MNIFILSESPIKAAQMQCNKHVNKMILESGQMLSTAHRMLDGKLEKRPSKSGKRLSKYYVHPDPYLEEKLYKAVHYNHPCTKWTMETSENYLWHYEHFLALAEEFEYRFGKKHMTLLKLQNILKELPKNIPISEKTQWPLAMKSNPECMYENDVVRSYREYYQTKQDRFKMSWTKRSVPEWFKEKAIVTL